MPSPLSIRHYLRECTEASHAELDQSIGGFQTREDYVRYCQNLLSFREPLEDYLANVLPDGLDGWSALPIAGALKADLADLSAAVLPFRPHRALSILKPGHTLGILYVLEGSSLGARILSVRAAALGCSAHYGARHLALQTRDRTAWPRFIEILESRGKEDLNAVADGAQLAFEIALEAFVQDRTSERDV